MEVGKRTLLLLCRLAKCLTDAAKEASAVFSHVRNDNLYTPWYVLLCSILYQATHDSVEALVAAISCASKDALEVILDAIVRVDVALEVVQATLVLGQEPLRTAELFSKGQLLLACALRFHMNRMLKSSGSVSSLSSYVIASPMAQISATTPSILSPLLALSGFMFSAGS